MPNDKCVARPALFLGLGSTGAKIVSKLKRLIEKEDDPWTSKFYHYVRITSEITPERGVDPDISPIVLSSRNLHSRQVVNRFWESMSEDVRKSLQEWWYPDATDAKMWEPWVPPVRSLDEGAGGVRPIGRLLLQSKCLEQDGNVVGQLQEIQRLFEGKQQRLPVEEQARVDPHRIDCYVFGLLAGGTCSGTLIDLAYLLKQAFGNTNVFGVFLLGDVCYHGASHHERDPLRMSTQRENTLYALAEMMVLHSKTGREIVSPLWPRQIGKIRLDETVFDTSPFHKITLIGAQNEEGHYLRGFDDYQNFVAEYYAGLFASEAHARQIGRVVDQDAEHNLTQAERFPGRANNLQRVGLLSLRIPEDKIIALARNDLAKEVATVHFKNAEPGRWEGVLDRLLSTISWGGIDAVFTPPDESIAEEEFDPLPSSAEEFGELCQQQKKDIDAFYGPWRNIESGELRKRQSEFEARWKDALNDAVRDLLGQVADRPLSVGSLEAVVKSLTDSIDTKIRDLDRAGLRLETEIFKGGEAGLEKRFQDDLREAVASFPRGLRVNPLTMIRRRLWSGQEDVAESLRRYRSALRTLATAKATQAALLPLQQEVKALSVVRKLVAGEAAQPVFMEQQRDADHAFEEAQQRRGLRQEIISGRDEIHKHYVTGILREVPEGASPGAEGAAQNRAALARSRIATSWRAQDHAGLYEAFVNLVSMVRGREDSETAENAMRRSDVSEAVQSLQNGLRTAFDVAVKETIEAAVNNVSVWEGIRRYILAIAEDPETRETTLRNMFTAYARKAKLFTRLTGDEGQDVEAEPRPLTFYMCNEEDARSCFKRMGLRNPDGFLQELLHHALGYIPTPMPQARVSRQQLLIFSSLEGQLPIYYAGFQNVLGLLQSPPVQSVGRERSWSDRRFPEWIDLWHGAAKKPSLPRMRG